MLLRIEAVISLSESSLEEWPFLSEFESSCELEGFSIVGCDEVLDDVSVIDAGLTFRFDAWKWDKEVRLGVCRLLFIEALGCSLLLPLRSFVKRLLTSSAQRRAHCAKLGLEGTSWMRGLVRNHCQRFDRT